MATVNPTIERNGDGSVQIYTYTGMENGDIGAPIPAAEWADRSVQVSGTFGAAGTVVWEGSNNASNYETLTDPQGNALSFTAASLEQSIEVTKLARPQVTGGDGTTSLTVAVLCRRPNNMRT